MPADLAYDSAETPATANRKGTRVHILITNDDGLNAPGLEALYRAVSPLGDVSVAAPTGEQSAQSHAISLKNPISVRETSDPLWGVSFAVDGSPADCVRLAVASLASSGDQITLLTPASCPLRTTAGSCQLSSQTMAVLSPPAVASRPPCGAMSASQPLT